LVTGGAGFIGSNIVDALLARGDDVRVIDDLSTGRRDNLDGEADLIEGSISDEDAVRAAMKGCEVVFHQAAHRAVLRSVEDPLATDTANVHGTLTILHAARQAGVRRVIYASSSSVYGGAAQRPTPESAPLLPRSPYAVTKLTGEHYCRVFSELHGLETVALRYFNVYGPRQRPDSMYAAVIPLFIDALNNGAAPTVHGDGHQSRDFTFIGDVVAANLAAATADASSTSGHAYNIACGDEHSLLELLEHLADIMRRRVDPHHVDPRAGDVRHSCADVSAAARDLGWRATTDFRTGLVSAVEYVTR
jgi:UDP-glucose 4-epimerase